MKIDHAPELRREATHVAGDRQLRVATAVWMCLGAMAWAGIPYPAERALAADLRAARLLASALELRHAPDEDWEKLDATFAEIRRKHPHNVRVLNTWAEILWGTGRGGRATELWQEAERLDPKDGTVLNHLGASYLANGEPRVAADYFLRAVNQAPNTASFHFDYANTAFLFRHALHDARLTDSEAVLAEAVKHYAEAARLAPQDAEFCRAYAEAFYTVAKPDWAAALAAWQHFQEVTGERDFASLNIARVQLKLGRKDEARMALGEVQNSRFTRSKAALLKQIERER